jgi:CDP-diacylglycerol---glycerol-3-phosphate 3-phosphatidyltransferase
MNLSTWLTLSRILLMPLLVVLLLLLGRNPSLDLGAAAVVLVAAVTDLLDGYLARRREQVTLLGIYLDPIADKILTSAAFICLVELRRVPAWMVLVIVGREFAVSGLREIASAEGFTIEPSRLGKMKMFMQMLAIAMITLELRSPRIIPAAALVLWIVVLLALASAGQYLWRYLRKHAEYLRQVDTRRVVVLQPARESERKGSDAAAH